MHQIFYMFSLIIVLVLSYTVICNFLGKPILMPYYFDLLMPAIIINYPSRIILLAEQDYQNNVTALQIPIHLIALYLLFILAFIIYYKKNSNSFHLMNTKGSPREITEEALENLNISFESQDGMTKIIDYDDSYIQYPLKSRLIFDKYANINFDKVEDKDLQKQIMAELRKVMMNYRKPRIMAGLFFSLFILAYIIEGISVLADIVSYWLVFMV